MDAFEFESHKLLAAEITSVYRATKHDVIKC